MESGVKVLLVDDHEMVRSGLRALLEQEDDMRVVGEACNGRVALEMIARLEPDVVVMDLQMPDLNGFDAARRALNLRPGLKIVALSASVDERATLEMLRAGAAGYVAKVSAFEELVTAIRTVVKNRVYFDSDVVAHASNQKPDLDGHTKSAFERLSVREREVLQLIAEGKATKEVAILLGVSVKTAETHRRNLMEKLNVSSIAELTKYAIREGLTGV
jgi:DNA-binding NarL/FixJ family response regulator